MKILSNIFFFLVNIFLSIGIFLGNIVYFFIKLLPTHKKKITFISRQSNEVALDIILLQKEICKLDTEIEFICLCRTFDKGLWSFIKYFFYTFVQLYHIATSKIVLLDTYCVPICMLKHKKSLIVIQIWHALGSLKKFSYSSLDTKDGRNKQFAKISRLHKNYDYILTSSELSKPFFMEAFHAKSEQMIVMNLPRVDYLKSKQEEKKIKKEFYLKYPKIDKDKKIILYCPTSRKNGALPLEKIVKSVDLNKYVLVLKLHDNSNQIYYKENTYYDEIYFSGMQFLHITDYIITDYSAIVYEAAITKKPIYFYIYDYDKYIDERGLYIDYKKEMPGMMSKDIKEIIKKIESNTYDKEKLEEFCHKYMGDLRINWTRELANFIKNKLN